MEPEQLHEFVHDLAEWTRRSGGTLWCGKAAQGSPFYWPPGVTNPGKDALALRAEAYERTLRQSGLHEVAQAEAVAAQQDSTLHAYKELAAYHATTLERAKLMYIGRDISYLAARTEMKEFRLDLDLFYLDPVKKKSLMTCGFMMWDTPIGEAEPRGQLTAQYDINSGELLEVDVVDDMMEGFRESETPVNALSWRILPGSEEVLLIFYTDGSKARQNYERYIAAQKKNLPPGMVLDKEAAALQLSDPQPLEREQVLPLNKTLDWFEVRQSADSDRERLRPTILSDPSYLREAERRQVASDFIEANEKILPMLSQMVKTFVATLAIRRMKLAQREEVPAPRAAVKRMRRSGASEERVTGGVQVVRIGQPLKHRTSSGGGGGKWKVKTIIGPVIRTRQYVPAHDVYREGLWEIEPYLAGPPDAPWSKNAKVFLLGDAPSDATAQKAEGLRTPEGGLREEKRGRPEGKSRPDDPVTFSMRNSIPGDSPMGSNPLSR
ncbi:hypothetical protein ACFW2V_12360 [Streptomyces sp. NPDC058947]|uniref:hypothetical protein n=1 Tax=Streptomyces sp. NPDC058947 TaxID=3346675 RepID=UPI0036876BAF